MKKNSSINSIVQNRDNVNYSGIEELWLNEKCLPKYNHSIVQKLSEKFSKGKTVLEFGAGLGTLAVIWRDAHCFSPVCIEIDPKLQELLKKRGFESYPELEKIKERFDFIYSSNVLEHIENDSKALRALNEKLNVGGMLALYLPAFPSLYSKFDMAIGHYRRYSKKDIIQKLIKENFVIEKFEYVDCLGFFAWLTTKHTKNIEKHKDQSRELMLYDQYIFPLSRFLDKLGLKFIFGKNIIVFARRIE